MKRLLLPIVLITIILLMISMNTFHRTEGAMDYVPDEKTAIKIAEAIWLPIYGEMIYESKPFKATLKNKVWTVTGTLEEDEVRGVPIIDIRKSDCKIMRVIHTK